MRNYLRNHNWATMFLGTWVAWVPCILLMRHLTITPMPWHFCIEVTTVTCAFASVAFGLLGYGTDMMHLDQMKREMLKKLES